MKKLEIQKTKPTFIISTFKTDIIKVGLVFSISNSFSLLNRLWQIIGGVLAAVIWLYTYLCKLDEYMGVVFLILLIYF